MFQVLLYELGLHQGAGQIGALPSWNIPSPGRDHCTGWGKEVGEQVRS